MPMVFLLKTSMSTFSEDVFFCLNPVNEYVHTKHFIYTAAHYLCELHF